MSFAQCSIPWYPSLQSRYKTFPLPQKVYIFSKLEVGGGNGKCQERKALKIQWHLMEASLLLRRLKGSSFAKRMALLCNVPIGEHKTISHAVGGTWPKLNASVFRKRQSGAEMGDSEVAALGLLCLHAFAHAVPIAQNTLPHLLSSLLLASHYLFIKISLGPPPPESRPWLSLGWLRHCRLSRVARTYRVI